MSIVFEYVVHENIRYVLLWRDKTRGELSKIYKRGDLEGNDLYFGNRTRGLNFKLNKSRFNREERQTFIRLNIILYNKNNYQVDQLAGYFKRKLYMNWVIDWFRIHTLTRIWGLLLRKRFDFDKICMYSKLNVLKKFLSYLYFD